MVQRATLRSRLRALYQGDDARARRFRYGLLGFDLATLVLVAALSFLPRDGSVIGVEVSLGLLLLAETAARTVAAARPWRALLSPLGLADAVAILSLLAAPLLGWEAGFLRSLRALRLLRSHRLLESLRADLPFFRAHEDAVRAGVHLVVFIFITTGLVYETQAGRNPQIGNYADALYFTIAALTTTGFGDITLPGTTGRLLSVAIMICGVTLFLRLAQALFRPTRPVRPCPACGLRRHEHDAHYCRGCGASLDATTDGAAALAADDPKGATPMSDKPHEPEGRFGHHEKHRGTPKGEHAGEAGEAAPKGRPSNDRELTESAAARTEADAQREETGQTRKRD